MIALAKVPRNTVLLGDALDRLRRLPDGSVDTVLTSPPYFRLRDYAADGQLGLEAHVDQWIERLVEISAEVHRVLVPTGTYWLNLGDTYSAHQSQGAARKSLLMAPERLALRLQQSGWIIRNKIVWAKPNPMPTSIKDRLNCTYEFVYVLAKQPGYFFDLDAIRVPHRSTLDQATGTKGTGCEKHGEARTATRSLGLTSSKPKAGRPSAGQESRRRLADRARRRSRATTRSFQSDWQPEPFRPAVQKRAAPAAVCPGAGESFAPSAGPPCVQRSHRPATAKRRANPVSFSTPSSAAAPPPLPPNSFSGTGSASNSTQISPRWPRGVSQQPDSDRSTATQHHGEDSRMTRGCPRRCHAAVPVSAPRVYRPHSTEEVAMSTPNESAKGVKTLGIRLQPDVHAQLSFIAQLREGTITDEIQIAIAEHIARAKDDPDLASRAAEARAEIEREAAARQQAIATLFAEGDSLDIGLGRCWLRERHMPGAEPTASSVMPRRLSSGKA